jgi:hypothetical protein
MLIVVVLVIAVVRIDCFLLLQVIADRLTQFELQLQMFFASQEPDVGRPGNFGDLTEIPWRASVVYISERANKNNQLRVSR